MRVFNIWQRFTVLGIALATVANTAWADVDSAPMVVFSKSGDTKPYFSEWRGGTWTPANGTAMTSVGATPDWVVVQNCPIRYETACATLDSSRKVNLLFHNGTSWTSPTQVCANTGTAAERAVSLAYENLSGDLLIAYWDTSLNKIGYRTYNGVTLSAQSSVNLPGNSQGKYVALYPKPCDDEIIMLVLQNNACVTAAVWNGSSWGSADVLSSGLAWKDQEDIALAYESLTGRALLMYSRNAVWPPQYRIWNGSSWSAEASAPSFNATCQWLRLAGDPDSNSILFGGIYGWSGTRTITVNVWNGSSWDTPFEVENSFPDADARRFDVAFEKSTGKGLMVYQEGTQTSLRYRTWNGSSWSSEQTGTNIGDAARFIQLRTGIFTGEVFIAASDAGDDLELVRWNGSAMSATQQLCSNLGGSATTEQFMMAMPAASMLFTDVSVAAGFAAQSSNNADFGSGLHWGDLNNDGFPDAIITGNQSSRMLLYNAGTGAFTVSTFGSGNVSRQGALLDADNDGDLDVWGLSAGQDQRLFLNNGAGTLTDAGAAGFTNPSNTEAVAAADVNDDGWCDLLMFAENGNWIGHHQGRQTLALVGTIAASYGLNGAGSVGNGDYCSVGDVNNDGHPDFFYHYNGGRLFLSNGDGTYTQNNLGISVPTGESAKIGSAWADYDNDGDLDLFVPSYTVGQAGYLWRNDVNLSSRPPTGSFTNVALAAGLTDASGQRSGCWGDYDNDGDLDLYVVTRGGAANVLYQNQGPPNWNFVAVNVGAAAPGDGHDAVFVDYDNDGDLDLAVTQQGATNTLLRNGTNNNNYLKVRVLGHGAGGTNRAAVGTRVELWNAGGSAFLARREIGVARGYGGAEPMWLHFGGVNPSSTYTVKVYFTGHPASEVYSTTVVPGTAFMTIGGTTIPQMLTIQEPPAAKIIHWREKPNRGP